jgi:hypothetical protein
MTIRPALVLSGVALLGTRLTAQYPLAPSPVLDLHTLSHDVRFGGYVSARGTERSDTATFVVNRARVTASVLPAPFAALRLQVDYAATGRTTGDTVPAIVLTDAFVQLVPSEPEGGARLAHAALLVGQFRTPFSLEFLTPFSLLQTANRSQAVDRLSTRRDIGVLGQVALGGAARVTGAVINGEGPNRLVNSDGREMAMGRVTVFPLARLALSAKYLGEGGDHRWGYDGRWMGRSAIIEGEFIARRGPLSAATTTDASGGYVLASYKVLSWLQPVVKWERLRDVRTTGAATTQSRLTYTTLGINLVSAGERIRLLVDGIFKSERPASTGNELIAQLVAIF